MNTSNDRPLPFWGENPNILFQSSYLFEFFPVEGMTYNQKLNSITRTVLILAIVGFLFTQNIRIFAVSGVTIFAIYLLHYYHELERNRMAQKKQAIGQGSKEGFENSPADAYFKENNLPIPTQLFDTPNSHNPFSNVLISDYDYNPNKKPAPPANNDNILNQAKQMVMDANPDQPQIADKLFNDLGEQYVFEQSLRPFHSNPGTTIPNDQGAFADFCYGSMVSCKEGNAFACARNLSRHTL